MESYPIHYLMHVKFWWKIRGTEMWRLPSSISSRISKKNEILWECRSFISILLITKVWQAPQLCLQYYLGYDMWMCLREHIHRSSLIAHLHYLKFLWPWYVYSRFYFLISWLWTKSIIYHYEKHCIFGNTLVLLVVNLILVWCSNSD